MKWGYVLLIGIFLLVGPAPLIGGAVWTWLDWRAYQEAVAQEEQRDRDGWMEAAMTVTACSAVRRNAETGDWTYHGATEWRDHLGGVHHSTLVGGSCSRGQMVPIRYNPRNPEEYTTLVGWFKPVPLILCLIGGGFTFIVVRSLVRDRKQPSAPPPAPS